MYPWLSKVLLEGSDAFKWLQPGLPSVTCEILGLNACENSPCICKSCFTVASTGATSREVQQDAYVASQGLEAVRPELLPMLLAKILLEA